MSSSITTSSSMSAARRPVADLRPRRNRKAGPRKASCRPADPFDRLRPACRQLSRPGCCRRLGVSDSLTRRSPHARHPVLVLVCRARRPCPRCWPTCPTQSMRRWLLGAMLAAYVFFAAVRILGIGDAAFYDSTAFFALCGAVLPFALHPAARIAAIGVARLGQLLHLPLAHLRRHGAARSHPAAPVRRALPVLRSPAA